MLSKSIPTKFEAGDVERLTYLSKLYDRPVSYLIREATRAYLDSQAKKLEFMEEAKTAADNLNQTWLHCEHKDVAKWLQSLADGQIVEPPKCHK